MPSIQCFHKTFASKFLFITLILTFALNGCQEIPNPKGFLSKIPLIPKPTSIEEYGSTLLIKNNMNLFYEDTEGVVEVAKQIEKEWHSVTGHGIKLKPAGNKSKGIFLSITEQKDSEDYEIMIDSTKLQITANAPEGLYRGWQTVKQMFHLISSNQGPIYIPTGKIVDAPNFEYRGTMLDVSRHFFSVKEVKEYIDLLSLYKFNHLHLHLADDQGWRIEIKSWPNLTKHGGSKEVGGGKGGFYTQEEYKELVKYAEDRFITIVPEIDMPGHTNAALASYPELNCDGKARELYTGIEVGFSTLCVKKEITYRFVEEVIGEIAAMTPGPYFHLGGDESHVTPKDEYLIFINRSVEIIRKYGKTPMGWDEFTAGDIGSNAVAQHWHTPENAVRGQGKGGKVVMSPAKRAYLDMQYDSTSTFGLHWAAYIDVKSGYDWDPETYIPGLKKETILGIEAPLWSETISNLDEVEYLAFPRLLGYAEIGWTPAKDRNWEDYRARLAHHSTYLQKLGVDYYKSPMIEWQTSTPSDR